MKKNAALNWVRLPLDGVENCRELGGYSTENGGQVKWHTFLRSSDMSGLTEEDIIFLEEYGVKTVIDLRREDEIELRQNPLSESDFCDYYNIPFSGQSVLELSIAKDAFMGDFYVTLLEESNSVKQMFDTIALAKEGAIVFHCSAGKDRTGILAMLLLGLVGVEKKDIISNYEVTYTNLESFHDVTNIGIALEKIPMEFLYSRKEYIIRAYEHIIEKYESIENYLQSKNIEQVVIDRVKERLAQGIEEKVIL